MCGLRSLPRLCLPRDDCMELPHGGDQTLWQAVLMRRIVKVAKLALCV